MPTGIINVRGLELFGAMPCVYVGRYMPNLFAGHPLANPFRLRRRATKAERVECLARYRDWLLSEPGHEHDLRLLAWRVGHTGLPLGCWCATWDGTTAPAPLCHAVVLAEYCDLILARKEPRRVGA